MSLKHNAASRLLGVFTLAILSFATVAEAQPYGPGQGGGMMGGDWGWGMGYGMGGFGGIGVLVSLWSSSVSPSLRSVAAIPDPHIAQMNLRALGSAEEFRCNTISPRP